MDVKSWDEVPQDYNIKRESFLLRLAERVVNGQGVGKAYDPTKHAEMPAHLTTIIRGQIKKDQERARQASVSASPLLEGVDTERLYLENTSVILHKADACSQLGDIITSDEYGKFLIG